MGCCCTKPTVQTLLQDTPPSFQVHAYAAPALAADRFRKVDAILASLESGAVRLVRGSYLVKLSKAGKAISRRQELPDEAFYDYAELLALLHKLREKWGKYGEDKLNENGDIDEFCGDTRFLMLIHALSYRWLEASHPDREGFHLRIIAEAAQMRIEDETIAGGSLWSDVFEPLGLSKADVDFGLFWDFPSLFQSDREKGVDDRSDAQKALFKSALAKGGALNVYYGHKYTNVWIQSELPEGFGAKMEALGLARTYKESGWCWVESALSALLKDNLIRFDLAKRNTPGPFDEQFTSYARLRLRCAVGRDPPLTPLGMSKIVRTAKRFTGKADCDVVDDMYGDFFEAAAPMVEEFEPRDFGWGEAEACAMAEVLPRCVNCCKVSVIDNPLGDAGAKAIYEALDAAPSVQEVGMINCGLGEGSTVSLAAVLQRNTSLTKVVLYGNRGIGDAGGLALAEAIGRNTTLRTLLIMDCGLGDDAKAALMEAASKRATDNELQLNM